MPCAARARRRGAQVLVEHEQCGGARHVAVVGAAPRGSRPAARATARAPLVGVEHLRAARDAARSARSRRRRCRTRLGALAHERRGASSRTICGMLRAKRTCKPSSCSVQPITSLGAVEQPASARRAARARHPRARGPPPPRRRRTARWRRGWPCCDRRARRWRCTPRRRPGARAAGARAQVGGASEPGRTPGAAEPPQRYAGDRARKVERAGRATRPGSAWRCRWSTRTPGSPDERAGTGRPDERRGRGLLGERSAALAPHLVLLEEAVGLARTRRAAQAS